MSLCVYLALSTAVCVVTMDTVLEQQRRLHEERERVEDALMKEMILKKNSVCTSISSDVMLACREPSFLFLLFLPVPTFLPLSLTPSLLLRFETRSTVNIA